jgi:glycosyltransferase involved in cell wall biosynthesis
MTQEVADGWPRICLVWAWVPSHHSGAAILMRRLLQDYPAGKLWLLTSSIGLRSTASFDPVPAPGYCHGVRRFAWAPRFLGPLVDALNYCMVPFIVTRGIRLIRRNSIKKIISVPWNEYSLAAYLLHLLTGSELFVYLMDDSFGEPSRSRIRRPLYNLLMGRVLRSAKRVWAISPYMCESLEKRFQVKCVSHPPFVDVDDFARQCRGSFRQADHEVHLVYTGTVYSAQLDALRDLIQVVNSGRILPDRRVILTLYTDVSESTLRKLGLYGSWVRRSQAPASEMARALGSAHILFLPYSFQGEMRHLVETSMPTKLAEYLVSGVPILVYAPPYASITRYCRKHGFGMIVDKKDHAELEQSLRRLTMDEKLRRVLVDGALKIGAAHHNRQHAVASFLRDLAS